MRYLNGEMAADGATAETIDGVMASPTGGVMTLVTDGVIMSERRRRLSRLWKDARISITVDTEKPKSHDLKLEQQYECSVSQWLTTMTN